MGEHWRGTGIYIFAMKQQGIASRRPTYLYTKQANGELSRVGEVYVDTPFKGLPRSPSYDTLVQYVLPFINDVLAEVLVDEKLGEIIPVDRVRGDMLRGDTDKVIAALLKVMEERGNTYGEDVLMALGEEAFIMLAFTKLVRLLWSWQGHKPFEDRKDSWLDLAGYAVLALSINEYMEDI